STHPAPLDQAGAGEGTSPIYTVSPSQIGRIDECPVCYYREAFLAFPGNVNPAVRKPVRELRASEFGELVHRAFLEDVASEDDCRGLVYREAAGFGLFTRDKKARRELDRRASQLWEQIKMHQTSEAHNTAHNTECSQHVVGTPTLEHEKRFSLLVGNLLFRGSIDLLLLPQHGDDAPPTIIDYKTDVLKEGETIESHMRSHHYDV